MEARRGWKVSSQPRFLLQHVPPQLAQRRSPAGAPTGPGTALLHLRPKHLRAAGRSDTSLCLRAAAVDGEAATLFLFT